jgi:bifunctional non-homologous end joining protein LigD
MEPAAAHFVPQGERFLYQVKWDGVRIIAHSGNGRLLLHNRKLHERTCHYPELVCLKPLCTNGAVFDGEIVALKNGRPSFPLVLRRDLNLPSGTCAMLRLVKQIPISYLVFDLIFYNGQNLTQTPLSSRQELLAEVLPENEHIHRVESFRDGISLFEAAKEKCLEGIVAKEKTSLYAVGGKTPAWLKIKIRKKQLAAVVGYTMKEGRVNSLLAGAYYSGRYICLGRVAAGLSARELAELTTFLKTSERSVSPFVHETSGKGEVWVEPKLTMLVEFQEWTEDLRMRHPVIKGFTKDKPEDCVLDSG